MISVFPDYYKDFSCIADKCSHSCCIGWEIDIDEKTLKKYSSLKEGYGKEIINTVENEEAAYFKLCEDERCPHLDEKGLCRIISNLGEDYLCEICREHPRFYNDTARGKFVGIGMACEEAARIILQNDFSIDEISAHIVRNAKLQDFDDKQICAMFRVAYNRLAKITELLSDV